MALIRVQMDDGRSIPLREIKNLFAKTVGFQVKLVTSKKVIIGVVACGGVEVLITKHPFLNLLQSTSIDALELSYFALKLGFPRIIDLESRVVRVEYDSFKELKALFSDFYISYGWGCSTELYSEAKWIGYVDKIYFRLEKLNPKLNQFWVLIASPWIQEKFIDWIREKGQHAQ